jgi:hypothetical protein
MSFEDFSILEFDNGFPVILLDLIYTLTGQLIDQKLNYSKDTGKDLFK